MNPIIKFSTLFGLLAVDLAVTIDNLALKYTLAAGFFLVGLVFVYRSFYGMRIEGEATEPSSAHIEANSHREREVATSGAR
jgi:K(+)-stimulated pyrophosphate-energized sodium pump